MENKMLQAEPIINRNRREFYSTDYNLFDRPAKELWCQYLYTRGFARVSSKENYSTPDVVAFKGLTKVKFELEARRNYDYLVWNSEFVTIPLKYTQVDDFRNFYHIILDCDEILKGEITKFARAKVEDIIVCPVIEKEIWSKKNQRYEREKFFQVPAEMLEKIVI